MKRTDLLVKLRVVAQALADTNLIPIYQCFCFDGHTVSAYNDTIGIVAECPTNYAFAVNGKILLGLLEASTAEDVGIDIAEELNEVCFTIGKNTSTLPIFPKSEFLFSEPTLKSTNNIVINDDLRAGLKACLLTSSKDLAHPAFMGVYMNQDFPTIVLYSTDGDAISSYITDKGSVGGGSMLPNIFCDTLLRFESDGWLIVDDEWAQATLNIGYTVYGRLIKLDNPVDHDAEIKATLKGKPKFIKVPDGLDDALSRARVVADPESKPTKIAASSTGIQLFTESAYGVIDDNLPDGYMPVEAVVSAELMQRCLKLCDEMTIQSNCCAFRDGKKLFILTSNMGE